MLLARAPAMTATRLAIALSLAAVLALGAYSLGGFGCGGGGSTHSSTDPTTGDASVPDAAVGADAAMGPAWEAVVASSLPYPDSFSSPTTFRVPFTTVRSGSRVEVTLWGQSAGMTVTSAWIGQWMGDGTVEGNAQLYFGGKPGVDVAPNAFATSDPLGFSTVSGKRYAVSFAATGTVPGALSDIGGEGLQAPGDLAGSAMLSGTADPAFRGIKWVAVLGPPTTRAVAVLGDSIGAGEASWGVDLRFVDLAQKALGYPVVDASEGGDGVERAQQRISQDVLPLPGITDCLVEIGTNDLHAPRDARFVIDGLTAIYKALAQAGLHPWGATILPKGIDPSTGRPHLPPEFEAARVQVNDFIKATSLVVGHVDFAAAIADPADPSKPAEGMLASDGIHPANAGHQAMADAMVKAFKAAQSQ